MDEYKDILSTPKDILDQSSCDIALTVLPFKNSVPSLIQQIDKDTRLERFINQYHHLIQHYKLTQEEFLQKIDTQPQHLSEIQAGSNQLKFEQQKIGLAQKLMNDQETWRQLGELIEIEVPKRHLAFLELEREALGLANEGPEDKKRKRSWLIEQAAKKRKHLDKADLNSLYLKADLNFTIKITGLNKEKAQKLHELIHATLTQGIHYQIAKKIQNAIQKSFRSQAAEDLVPALDLLAKKIIPGLELPAIVLLQHEEGIILRTRQVSALKTLLQTNSNNFKETVEKIIPGGGKSKVIIPIVAEEKAKGSNLIIVEVPQALLATNYVDLNRVSQRLFGKTAYRFDFNRESDCSAKRLESIYNKFKEVMTTRSYLVCAGESMQSLELKYLELLFSEPPHDKEWEKQIYWCDKLVNLIRHHGEAIIDEVHQGLWIKKKLNYTIGEQKPLSISIINNAIALFQFIDPEFIKTAPLLNEDYDWTSFQHQLANKLLTEVTSPLHNYVKFIEKESGAAAIKDLFSYLTNTANCETLLAKAPADCKAALAFFKQQINSVLPATLTRRLNTNYGASKKENLSAIEQTHAIPYEANNIANERSRFGNNLEAMNYACQMLFIKGVSKELLQEHLKQIQAIARQELFKNKQFRFLDETPTAQGFALLWPDLGLNLSQIKPEDKKQLSEIHQRLKNNKALILEILQQHSLKLIPRDGSIIHSDSFNHVDLYHSVQAVSGTPSNHTTYHQRLAFDRKASLGTDGYIIQLLQHKKTAIKAIDYQNLTQFVPDLLAQSPTHCRAIIDIRAAFQGIENLSVAKELAAYIKKQKKQFSTPLKHVLYFNEQQILCALDINKPNTPIILKTTDVNELNRILGSTPNERFTYFDQVHTLGTDLTQDEHAHALVLVDEKTSLQSFLQGSMRMRGLGEKQSIEIITPTKLSGITSTELINKFSKAESQTLLMDNLFAAKGQMTNLLRRHCLDQIEKLPSDWVKTKATLAQRFKTFFVHDASQDLFELYGAISKKQPTKQILEQHKKQLLNRYLHTFTAETVPLSEITLNKINLELDKLITKALGCCLEEYEHGVIDLAVEVEAQKEIQKQSQIQIASINEFFDPHLKESKPVEWETLSLNSLYSKQQEIDKCSLLVNSLAAPKEKPGFLFSEHLRVSRSYAQTHTKQQKYLDAFLKPASVIWYYKEASILRAMIITPQDLEGLYKHIANTPNNWVSTTEGTVLCGEQPKGIQATKTYQSLRDQVRFFNGEFNAFLEPEGNSEWLNEAVSPKLQFFEESLLPYRPDCEKKFQELKTLLTQASIEGFAYIAEHPHQDLTRFNWQSLFPETSPAQGEEYRKMAAAFVSIQAQWQNNIPQLNNVQEQFRLPLKCLSYVNSHLLDLKKLSNLLENIRRASLSLGNLVLNPEEQVLLEFYLNKPLKEFYIPQQNNACAFIDLLEQLYTHPAFNNKRDLGQNLQRMAQVSTSVEVLLKILDSKNLNTEVLTSILYSPIKDPGITNKLLELPLSLFSEDMLALFFMRCNEEQHINILLKKADLPPLLLKLILDKYPNEAFILNLLEQTKNYHVLEIIYQKFQNIKSVRQAIYQHPALTSTSLLAITNLHLFFDEKELTELLINSKAPIDALILSAIGINSPYNESLFLIIAKHPKANPQVIESLLNHPQCRPQLIQKIMNIKGSNIEYETLKTIVRKVYNYTVYFSSKGDREEWEHCCLKGFKALNHFANTKADVSSNDNSSFISSLISSFDLILHPQFAIKILKIFKQGVSLKLPFESMINDASFEELKILIDYKYTGPLSDPILEQLYKKLSTPELFDLFTKRPDLSPRLSLKLVSNMDISEEQLQTVIANSPQEKVLEAAFLHPKTSAEGKKNISEALARSKILSSPYVAPVQENQTMQQQYLKTKFLSAVEQLKLKAEAHAMKTKTNPLFEENAKKTAALHKKILANQEQIFKGNTAVINSLMLAIKDASPTLATHRGYKEVIYDVLNLLLNIVTFGLKSRTTGDWRFFKPKTDSLLLVEEIKKCMEPFNPVQVSSLELN